jgi:hypothetical protein
VTQSPENKPAARPGTHRVLRFVSRSSGEGGEVRAVVEDNYHHFRVAIRHDGIQVIAVSSNSPRHPYTLCPSAGDRLNELIGMQLSGSPTFAYRHTDVRFQCTHQFDLAAIALAAAVRGVTERRYDMAAYDEGDQIEAILLMDGRPRLHWDIERHQILSPAPYAGRALGSGFTDWVASSMEAEEAEAALVLRRLVMISGGRNFVINEGDHPVENGSCWIKHPERRLQAVRADVRRDFSENPEILANDQNEADWLRPKS